MTFFKRTLLPVILATVWISISEFARNQFILKAYWTEHYKALGLAFPSEPVNGAMWGVWSLLFAIAIRLISRKFNLIQATLISWFFAFVMMWVVTWNLGVLPIGILSLAVPLSLLEAFVATIIVKKLS
jgi:hypothetical protein